MKISTQLNVKQTQKISLAPKLIDSLQILNLNNLQLYNKIYEKLNENPFLEEIEERSRFHSLFENKTNCIDEISYQISLKDFIENQILEIHFSKEEKKISEIFLSYLNKKGFFSQDLKNLSLKHNLSFKKAEYVLEKLKNLEPVGIFSTNVQECLLKQSEIFHSNDKELFSLIKNHWQDLEKLNYKKIQKQNLWTDEFLSQLFKKMKTLSPYPISHFENQKPYIIPELSIQKFYDKWNIIIEDYFLPKIKINDSYEKFSKENKNYFQTKMNEAKCFSTCIEKRKQTLYKFGTTLLDLQVDFFKKGKEHLKPLTLSELGAFMNLHKSTISRLVKNKFIKTDFGTFPLKYFFSSGIRKMNNVYVSSRQIKEKISSFIRKEDREKPLSDLKISNLLLEEEIIVSKRLVAKYRNQMSIMTYNKRKVFYFINK